MNRGIDYGMGTANRDPANGIRYGVLPIWDVLQAWLDSSEAQYGEPTCPTCENVVHEPSDDERENYTAPEHDCSDYACSTCSTLFDSSHVYAEDPLEFTLDDGEYAAQQSGDDTDIFITKSPYFTYAQFCSACAPGACHLRNPLTEPHPGNRAYCFGHDFFDTGVAPYPLYSVATGEPV